MNFGAKEKQAYHNATLPRFVAGNTKGHIPIPSLKPFASPAEVTFEVMPPVAPQPVSKFWRERYIIWPRRLTSGRLAYLEHVWQRGDEYCEWEM